MSVHSHASCPGTCSKDQAGLELTEICLSLPPKSWDQRGVPPHCLAFSFYLMCFVFFMHFCMCTAICAGTYRSQKRELDILELKLQEVVNHRGCWELNLDSLGEQQVLLIS